MQKKLLLTACLCFLAGLLGGFFLSRAGAPREPEGAAFKTLKTQESADDAGGINLRADFNPQSALIIGANEMVRYHQRTFIEMIQAVGPRTPVIALVNDSEEYNTARELLNRAGVNATNVFYLGMKLNSMWVRDYGPLFVNRANQIPYIIDFDYSNVDEDKERWRDNDFTIMFGNISGLEVRHTPLRMEGGNLLSNGDGLCLTTTSLIDRNISRGYSKEQIGEHLRNAFGFDSWVYLQTLKGETTGHVDMFVTFLRRNLALVAQIDPATDPENAALLDETADLLSRQMSSFGRIRVHRIPMLSPKDGNFYSYNNVVFINGRILVPAYSDVPEELQREAHQLYRKLMPSWTVVPVNVDTMVRRRGLLRCCTIPVPAHADISAMFSNGLLVQ